jgi:hypothetical protein
MAVRLSYSYNTLLSDEETDEYEEHRGQIRFTLTPSQPFRYLE